MCETTSLLLHLILTLKALQPEPTKFGLDLTLPRVLKFLISFLRCANARFDSWRLVILDGLAFTDLFEWAAFNN